MSNISTDFYKLDLSKDGSGKDLTRIALVSDLHGDDPSPTLATLGKHSPDLILAPGDIFDSLDERRLGDARYEKKHHNSLSFLKAVSGIAPTFMSLGNHENGGIGSWHPGWGKQDRTPTCSKNDLDDISRAGVTLLDDRFVVRDGLVIGGLSSGLINKERRPNTAWLDGFCRQSGIKILLCHHPEYYQSYLKELDIDLFLSGHAHGGQWRFLGRGMFAPGQGLFPKYTSGLYDGRLIVSRGLQKSGTIPRIFNRTQIIFVDIKYSRQEDHERYERDT